MANAADKAIVAAVTRQADEPSFNMRRLFLPIPPDGDAADGDAPPGDSRTSEPWFSCAGASLGRRVPFSKNSFRAGEKIAPPDRLQKAGDGDLTPALRGGGSLESMAIRLNRTRLEIPLFSPCVCEPKVLASE
jgi:hypothetical protein